MGPRGGVVTQRSAKPCTPVQFWSWPPLQPAEIASKFIDPRSGQPRRRVGRVVVHISETTHASEGAGRAELCCSPPPPIAFCCAVVAFQRVVWSNAVRRRKLSGPFAVSLAGADLDTSKAVTSLCLRPGASTMIWLLGAGHGRKSS